MTRTDCVPGHLSMALMDHARQAAREASQRAYVPYSHFPVGAVVVMKNGDCIQGCNIENASYPLTNCAERTAIFSAIAQGWKPEEMEGLVLYTPTSSLTPPCGACRQVLAELMGANGFVWVTNDTQDKMYTVADLLPDSFGEHNLDNSQES